MQQVAVKSNKDQDYYSPLIDRLTSATQFTEEQVESVREHFRVKRLVKREMLIAPGTVSNHLYFIASGCMRVFYQDAEKEITTQFGIEGWCINDLQSFLEQKPARQFIQAVEPTVVLQIHRDALQRLNDAVPPFERFMRLKFESAHQVLQERHLESILLSASERYELFRKKYREIEQRVPQYMVASYLGITKEFLSHLRSKN
ncbi:Crp/Fnr family transcriptional regulator [Roseivirga sp.]|uniref:Crp/Fnr family transcriptional regulator n=1 Tax=Roseivirga sp. TaxID=1964215 RepID=UPI003B524B08